MHFNILESCSITGYIFDVPIQAQHKLYNYFYNFSQLLQLYHLTLLHAIALFKLCTHNCFYFIIPTRLQILVCLTAHEYLYQNDNI